MKIILLISVLVLSLWTLLNERRRIGHREWVSFSYIRLLIVALFAMILWDLPLDLGLFAKKEKGAVLVIDGSRSMAQRDGLSENRFRQAVALSGKLTGIKKIQKYIFDKEGLREFNENMEPEYSDSTDLIKIIENIAHSDPGEIILLSDGNQNVSVSSVTDMAKTNFPVHTIGIGPEELRQRSFVSRMDFPEKAAPGQKVAINLHLDIQSDKAGEIILANESGKIIRRARYSAKDDIAPLEIISNTLGLNRYIVSMISGGDTLDRKNLAIDVRKEKINVLYMSGHSGWNVRFLLQTFSSLKDIAVDMCIWQKGRWALGPDVSRNLDEKIDLADVILLEGLSADMLNETIEERIIDRVQKGEIGLFILGLDWMKAFRGYKLSETAPLAQISDAANIEGKAVPTKYFYSSGIFDLAWSIRIGERISNYPPLALKGRVKPAASDVVVVANIVDRKESVPFWGWRFWGQGRVMQMTVSEIWPWKLTAEGILGDSLMFPAIVAGCIRWLAGRENNSFELSSDRSFYYPDEHIGFSGKVSMSENEPVSDWEWIVEIKNNKGFKQRVQLSKWETGSYFADAGTKAPGSYSYTSSVWSEGKKMSEFSGKFWVEPFPLHEREPLKNSTYLKEISKITGGKYWDSDSLSDNDDWIAQIQKVAVSKRRTVSRGFLAILLAIFLLVEWYWRRRLGLN
jgi:hypothetical protein